MKYRFIQLTYGAATVDLYVAIDDRPAHTPRGEPLPTSPSCSEIRIESIAVKGDTEPLIAELAGGEDELYERIREALLNDGIAELGVPK